MRILLGKLGIATARLSFLVTNKWAIHDTTGYQRPSNQHELKEDRIQKKPPTNMLKPS
jgi:hypothetical protein